MAGNHREIAGGLLGSRIKNASQLSQELCLLERGEKTPTPKISALLRKRPVLLRANFVLTIGHF